MPAEGYLDVMIFALVKRKGGAEMAILGINSLCVVLDLCILTFLQLRVRCSWVQELCSDVWYNFNNKAKGGNEHKCREVKPEMRFAAAVPTIKQEHADAISEADSHLKTKDLVLTWHHWVSHHHMGKRMSEG